jgi:hypothetical protein
MVFMDTIVLESVKTYFNLSVSALNNLYSLQVILSWLLSVCIVRIGGTFAIKTGFRGIQTSAAVGTAQCCDVGPVLLYIQMLRHSRKRSYVSAFVTLHSGCDVANQSQFETGIHFHADRQHKYLTENYT